LDEVLTRTDAAGLRAWLADALGSPLALADGAGTVQTEYTYAPFGETTVTGAANSSSYRFTGREDDGTGLYSYRARYYHPSFGRFLSEDPLGQGYTYAANSPARFTDPLGLCYVDIA
jgi:RHS repeat-associated protein